LVEILEKSLESYCREINWKGGLSKTKVKHNNLTEREREREREQKSKIEPKK
jgi:hypothetical protein